MKKFHIGVAGLNHESNTFNPIITTKDDFFIIKGFDFIEKKDTYGSAKGIVEALQSYGYEIYPTVFARAVPNGIVSKDFYLEVKHEIIKMLLEAKNLDAIVLALHGSMYVEDIDDAEGMLLESIRQYFKDIPIFVALDMHTTFTNKMEHNANAFVGYKTAPHIDTYETGVAAAYMAKLSLEYGKNLTMSSYKIPMLIAGEKSESSVIPMKDMIKKLIEEEKNPKIISASYLLGFPWADSKEAGVTVIVVTDNDKKLSAIKSHELAKYFWDKRDQFKFHVETYDNDQSLEKFFSSKNYPTFLSDSGDNPTAGATGDSTDLLSSLLKRKEINDNSYNILYSGFFDSKSMEIIRQHNIGDICNIELGGHFDKANGKSISMDVKILCYVKNYGSYNSELALVKFKNIDIVITSKHIGFGDDGLLEELGINVAEKTYIIVKLGYLEDCFKRVSKYCLMATSLGCSNEILETIKYKNIPRPFYPLDKDIILDI